MQTTIHPIQPEEKEILSRLLEKYMYEFSQYDGDSFDENGLFGYRYLDTYWTDPKRHAYFIRADGRLAGFVLVNSHAAVKEKPIDWAVAEFFVAYPYRRQGVATAAMLQVFAQHPGRWQIKYHPKNTGSAVLWNKLAGRFGPYTTLRGDNDYGDGTPAEVVYFSTLA